MKSLVGRLRKELESRGEYVVAANASTGWFAVFPTTWLDRSRKAQFDGREGPNLIVCRTQSASPRDHYVVPYRVICGLLVESTLTTSKVNGSLRWNLTLKKGCLHVSHRAGSINVSTCHGNRLIVEETPIFLQEPTDDFEGHQEIGAGFGRSDENRKIEEAAVKLVCQAYRDEGWQVESVEGKRCGYDLLCVRDREEAHVEVKGVASADCRFMITAGELRCALKDDQFVLALVSSALSTQPLLKRLQAEKFRTTFAFEPIQYWANPLSEPSAELPESAWSTKASEENSGGAHQ